MSSDEGIAAFLAARLDEDEAAAKERRGIFPSPAVEDSGAVWLHIKRGGNAVVAHYLHPVEGYGDMADLRAWADTDLGWTQDRALREVSAKRAILAEHRCDDMGWCTRCQTPVPDAREDEDQFAPVIWPCPTVRITFAVYSDHPDYREEWRP